MSQIKVSPSYNQKPVSNSKGKFLIVTEVVEGDCFRSRVKNVNGLTLFDTYWLADRWGVAGTFETSVQWAEEWLEKLDRS